MINQREIIEWGVKHPWPTAEQVEQDLLLSQAMCEIANDPLLGGELVLRGGTAFHKIFLPQPRRYSEDLDYVRMTTGAIGNTMKSLTSLGQDLGYKVNTKMGIYPKVFWKFTFASGLPGKIKIEINTFERSPMLPLAPRPHEVMNAYCETRANVSTFQVEELVATKLRALYQRSKGRDLYDLWLALTELQLSPEKILAAYPIYQPANTSKEDMIANLRLKLKDEQFCNDMNNLARKDAPYYDAQVAGDLIIGLLLDQIEGRQ